MADTLSSGVVAATSSVSVFADDGSVDAAFTALYEAHFSRVYALVRAQVLSTSDAHDLVGRIFLKAYAGWRRAPRGEEAVWWLFRIARTTLIDYRRVEGRRASVRASLDDVAEIRDNAADPEAGYSAKERGTLLLEVVGRLDANSRMLLNLKFTARRTNREIAGILRISEAAVSMRLMRALRRLRDELTTLGVS